MPIKSTMRRGAAGQQYAIIVGLIGVIAISAVALLGRSSSTLFTQVSNRIGSVTNGPAQAAAAPPEFTCANGATPLAKLVNAGGTKYYLCRGARSFNLPGNAVTSCLARTTINTGSSFTSLDGSVVYGALRYETSNKTASDVTSRVFGTAWRIRGCVSADCNSQSDTSGSGPAGTLSYVAATDQCAQSYDGYDLTGASSGNYESATPPNVWNLNFIQMGALASGFGLSGINIRSTYILRGQNSQSFVQIADSTTEKAWLEQGP